MILERRLPIPFSITDSALPVSAVHEEVKLAEAKKTSPWAYKSFAGHLGSSSTNFVLTDWAISKVADLLHCSDTDLIKAKEQTQVGHSLPRW